MKKKVINTIIVVVLVILGILLVWGFIGANEAQNPGITCDTGIGHSLCWKWHTNPLGELQEAFEDLGKK
jgi:hypothetical protein